MLVDRRILNIARTKMDDALTLLMDLRARMQRQHSVRIYTGNVAPFDQIVIEIDFADWSEMEAFWSNAETNPEVAAFFVKWEKVALPGGKRELWETV